ncbi:hypothetical protein LSH36_147g09030 [Paralvinella palmiformis]|uniref:Cation/H+ exchanger transmembrane domain-containing protein n=1 Tax=Paralvinella palmiformis TaxID=53620 RepID=A0AAD9JUP3_9ANNE|nr:hypothetical protein LSH36_147g09030 [Paralvinella palmiformis]
MMTLNSTDQSNITDSETAIENKEPTAIIFIFFSFTLGAVIRSLLKKVPLPYTVVLMVMGCTVGIISRYVHSVARYTTLASLDPHTILNVFLPVLIFESAFNMEIHMFMKSLPQVLLLAVPGLLFATFLTCVYSMFVFSYGWSWSVGMLFGSLISATDPVAVVALLRDIAGHCLSDFFNLFVVITPGKKAPILFFRCRDGGQNGDISSSTGDDNDGGPLLRGFGRVVVICDATRYQLDNAGAHHRKAVATSNKGPKSLSLRASKELATIVEGESMLNDGAAIVLFKVFKVMAASGSRFGGLDIMYYFLRVVIGGPLFGFIMAKLTTLWLGNIFNDALTEITITLCATYVTFYIGEVWLDVSGVLALVVLGVTLSASRASISPEVEVFLHRSTCPPLREYWCLVADDSVNRSDLQ